MGILCVIGRVGLLQGFEQLRRFAADRLAVQLHRLNAQAARAADDDFVRLGKLLLGVGFFLVERMQLLADKIDGGLRAEARVFSGVTFACGDVPGSSRKASPAAVNAARR